MSDHVPQAHLRLSDTERTALLDALSEQYVAGRIDLAEFDERNALIVHAKTFGEVEPAFEGIPGGVPFTQGGDGRLVPAVAGATPEAEDQATLDQVVNKGRTIEKIDTVVGVCLMIAMGVGIFAHVPRWWLSFFVAGGVCVLARLIVGFEDDEEKAYAELKKAEEAARAERLQIAMERRRELER